MYAYVGKKVFITKERFFLFTQIRSKVNSIQTNTGAQSLFGCLLLLGSLQQFFHVIMQAKPGNFIERNLFLSSVLAMWILSYDWQFELYNGYLFRPWRLLLILYAIPGIVGGVWLLWLPESPKFLLSVNRDEEALEIVRWMYRTNKGQKNNDGMTFGKLESEASEASLRNEKGM